MSVVAAKVAFDNGGAFIQETRSEVELYLSRGSTRLRGKIMLYVKAPIALALTAVSWGVLIVLHPGVVVGALCLVGLVAGAMLAAFCVQHDANHGAYFKQRRWNHLVGWSTDALLGFSSYAWRVKHNVAHHTYTNVDGFDDDATQVPLARFTPQGTFSGRWPRRAPS
jgi:linoleoyl-CoA desaturase